MENCHLLVYSFQNLFWQVTAYLSWWGLSTFQILFIIYIYFLVKYVILYWKIYLTPVQFSSVTQSCPTLWDPMDCSTPGFPIHQQFPKLLKLMSIESVMPSNHFILCHPLLLLPSIFPSIRVFSNEAVLHIRWSKYWSFSFSISLSNEYWGLISFRIY